MTDIQAEVTKPWSQLGRGDKVIIATPPRNKDDAIMVYREEADDSPENLIPVPVGYIKFVSSR